ncbi:uncharacterized protein LOC113359830 [Papaver somniferum]|uniref:uncharacterized protein LOC113359830 n=1 Tax=Papaver somniferum TaxID=3469 RepID=UPI000E702868|nr:uncharacterized protein LOC113359830 [Papaver somniferum]
MNISDNSPFDVEALKNLVEAENVYNSREVQLHTLLKQKSRLNCVKDGASNTTFLHANLKVRKTKNLISEIEMRDGNVINNQKDIADELVSHFEKKFEFQDVLIEESLLKNIPEVISSEDQTMLDKIPEEEEIKDTIFSIDPDSSPGSDGFSGIFYRACWQIIKENVVQAIQFCWSRKFIPKGLNSKFLVLLPKVEGAKSPNQFRPIGLSNVSFKIFTKLITNRMSGLMAKIISSQQAAYVKGRCIQEQILLASKMVNEMKKKRRCGNVGLKLDISQAYDSSAKIFVMLNGGPSGFSSVDYSNGNKGGIHPTHLMLADDVFIFLNGAKKSVTNLLKLLDDYQKSSGQVINKLKSKYFIDGTSDLRKNYLQNIIQMKVSVFPDKYLGVILVTGKVKSSTIWPMMEIMQRKLATWKGKLLSFQERLVLIKSVLCSIPVYNMAIYKWPSSVIKACEKIIRNFLWYGDSETRKYKVLYWRKVCTPYSEGGLGIQRIEVINKAFLMKMLCKIVNSQEDWALFFKSKYKDKHNQWCNNWKMSSVWNGLKWAWQSLQEYLKWSVGNGKTISLWFDVLARRFPTEKCYGEISIL